jgi:CDP-4-dehydro-6-deoxyglucose reductase
MTMDDKTSAQVESIIPLTDSILQVILAPNRYIDYKAGQYLQIMLGEDAMCYSIANAPLGSRKYELHIRHHRDNAHNQALLAEMKNKGTLNLRVPLGQCHVGGLSCDKPILFIAGGTGFAPIKAMIEHLLAQGSPPPIELYWGARSQSDLYMDEKVVRWQTHLPRFHYFHELFDAANIDLVPNVLVQHPADLLNWQIVIAGSFDMAHEARNHFIAHGAQEDHLFSDAF